MQKLLIVVLIVVLAAGLMYLSIQVNSIALWIDRHGEKHELNIQVSKTGDLLSNVPSTPSSKDKIPQLEAHHAKDFDGGLYRVSPPPLPSVRLNQQDSVIVKKIRGRTYGGDGDKLHLGGFRTYDKDGISNNTWNFMLGPLGIRSVMDLGCGVGVSTSYFHDNGADVLCVEGSHDAVTNSLLDPQYIVEHDFTRGPWWPNRTYDAVWSVEFLEHVGRQYMHNYFPLLRRAAVIFATSSIWGGWHHAEVRPSWWWRARFEAAGFVYSKDLTERVRNSARATRSGGGYHIIRGMNVYINPLVASLPEHDHIFGGHGCYFGTEFGVPCDYTGIKWYAEDVDALPPRYQSLLDCRFEFPPGVTLQKQKSSEKNNPDNTGYMIYDCTKNPLAKLPYNSTHSLFKRPMKLPSELKKSATTND